MIANTSDGSQSPPRLRTYLNLMALEGLPEVSAEGRKTVETRAATALA